jgi:hypothetical protein
MKGLNKGGKWTERIRRVDGKTQKEIAQKVHFGHAGIRINHKGKTNKIFLAKPESLRKEDSERLLAPIRINQKANTQNDIWPQWESLRKERHIKDILRKESLKKESLR